MDEGNSNNNTEVFLYTEGSLVPEDVVHVRVHPSVTAIPREAFYCRRNCHRQLEEVELCEGLIEIGERAFFGCSKLKRISICEGLIEIGKMAFMNCRSLKHINIPTTVTKIGEYAFERCNQLEEVNLSEGLVEIGKRAFFCAGLKEITIPPTNIGLTTLQINKMPSTVTRIGDAAFYGCNLEGIDLSSCESLLEIESYTFFICSRLSDVRIPTNVKRIGGWAFGWATKIKSMCLPNGIESIGKHAFYGCTDLMVLRIPPLIKTIPEGMVGRCEMHTIELCDSITDIELDGFNNCHSLRNISIPHDADIGVGSVSYYADVFYKCFDLQQPFRSEGQLIHSLKHRFDNLPIHKMIYYQSYNNMTVDQLSSALDKRSGHRRSPRMTLDQPGNKQDCMGMTPLHVLACSSIQSIELYKSLVTKYPENLVVEDGWGDVPLLYAVWSDAPMEILQFLVESYKSLYPNYELDWTGMMKTLGVAGAQNECILKLHDIQQTFFPEQSIDWTVIIQDALTPPDQYYLVPSSKSFGNLVQCSISDRRDKIGLKQWRDDISDCIRKTLPTERNKKLIDFYIRRSFLTDIETILSWYEDEYHKLKEATSILELALWKSKIDGHRSHGRGRCNKKIRVGKSDVREQCRFNCGADIVIQHVLPYLVSNYYD